MEEATQLLTSSHCITRDTKKKYFNSKVMSHIIKALPNYKMRHLFIDYILPFAFHGGDVSNPAERRAHSSKQWLRQLVPRGGSPAPARQ